MSNQQKDFDRLLRFAQEMKISANCIADVLIGGFEARKEFSSLLYRWTKYCVKYNVMPDTSAYDTDIMAIYSVLHSRFPHHFIWRPEDMDEDEKSYFDLFDLYMGQLLA